jgi:hypothetical protein
MSRRTRGAGMSVTRRRTAFDLLLCLVLRIERLSTGVHLEIVFITARIGGSDGGRRRQVQVGRGGRGHRGKLDRPAAGATLGFFAAGVWHQQLKARREN